MTTFLISVLAALGVVMIITVLGLILAQLFIKRANQAQIHPNILSAQLQGIVIDIDELPEAQQESGITVISNDVINGTSHRHHHHLKKKTISVIDHITGKTTTTEQTDPYQDRAILSQTNSDMISSDTSVLNPLTDKITLEY